MPTNVLAVGLFAVTAAFVPAGIWLLKLKQLVDPGGKSGIDNTFAAIVGGFGAYAFLAGFYLMAVSPLQPPYNEFFGAIHLYYGLTLIIGAQSVSRGWDLRPVSILAVLGGALNVLYVLINANLIKNPSYPIVFLPAALVGFVFPLVHVKPPWGSRAVGILCIMLGLITLYVGWNAFQGHIAVGLRPPTSGAAH